MAKSDSQACIARDYDAPMLRTREEGNRIKGLRKLECPNHLGGCCIFEHISKSVRNFTKISTFKGILLLALGTLYLAEMLKFY
ncbi:hypothetical protein [Kamptonema sp. UHCC 0994]|uniref:hypothetical protein n=1 Tax=Kamptonema sp. UHCC 0994 TaxID=3031329 RepID=UPI0023BA5723|nr:hypothetical protein [Kamptonema sp. UHCC 0994]MDF0556183.1 hypothetical protein [Kamptonema sp. UHCC 0994]